MNGIITNMDTLSEMRRKAEQAKQHLKDFEDKCEGKETTVEYLKNMFGMNKNDK